MNKLPVLLFATLLLLACNIQNKYEKSASSTQATHEEHTEKLAGLNLNNGAKWKTDTATFENAISLQKIVSVTKTESLPEYLQTAAALQDGLNKMVSECKMSGADHEALHHWLEPLLEQTKQLQQATTKEIAVAALINIEKQLNLFTQYFQQL